MKRQPRTVIEQLTSMICVKVGMIMLFYKGRGRNVTITYL